MSTFAQTHFPQRVIHYRYIYFFVSLQEFTCMKTSSVTGKLRSMHGSRVRSSTRYLSFQRLSHKGPLLLSPSLDATYHGTVKSVRTSVRPFRVFCFYFSFRYQVETCFRLCCNFDIHFDLCCRSLPLYLKFNAI